MKRSKASPQASFPSVEEENVSIVSASRLQALRKKRKPLPANCNPSGSSHVLFQLDQTVRFKCSYCEKRNILADEVALDEQKQTLQCKKCYERLIRPRMYHPLKVHPSKTYLKWMRGSGSSYNEEKLYSSIKRLSNQEYLLSKSNELDDIPVEAFFPSGGRLATSHNFENIRSIKYMCGVEGGEFDDSAKKELEKNADFTAVPNDARALRDYLTTATPDSR
ncbi:actin superfamily [Perkinsela sp. CCAP 1560/4]|nr:actin superfamily [Perkinsela sp. CCAP 1560/4]|eukprot:KNH05282.1 actin superfamily [Perkinsela sp. CCAP 1560/4]